MRRRSLSIRFLAFCTLVFWSNLFSPATEKAVSQTTTLNLSRDLVSLGIAANNMIPNQPSQDAGPLVRLGVAYAMTHQIGRVIADQGTYYFLSLRIRALTFNSVPTLRFRQYVTSRLIFRTPVSFSLALSSMGSSFGLVQTWSYKILRWIINRCHSLKFE